MLWWKPLELICLHCDLVSPSASCSCCYNTHSMSSSSASNICMLLTKFHPSRFTIRREKSTSLSWRSGGSCISLKIKWLFISQSYRERKIQREREIFHFLIHSLDGPTVRIESDQKQKPGTSFRSSTWVTGAQILGPYSATFSKSLAKSWVECVAMYVLS